MTEQQATLDLARQFFDAVERGDIAAVRAAYSDDARIWHNFSGVEQTPDENAETLRGFVSRIADRQYRNRRIQIVDGGFVQQHELHGTRGDGAQLVMPACMVCAVRDGKITRIDEYLDSAQVAEFRKVF